jgi:hypothetical protein
MFGVATRQFPGMCLALTRAMQKPLQAPPRPEGGSNGKN